MYVDIHGKRRIMMPNLRGEICKRAMTEAGLKEANTTKAAAWRKELNSYRPTGDPR